MANLNIEQKKVKSLFQESKYNFLIPCLLYTSDAADD